MKWHRHRHSVPSSLARSLQCPTAVGHSPGCMGRCVAPAPNRQPREDQHSINAQIEEGEKRVQTPLLAYGKTEREQAIQLPGWVLKVHLSEATTVRPHFFLRTNQ